MLEIGFPTINPKASIETKKNRWENAAHFVANEIDSHVHAADHSRMEAQPYTTKKKEKIFQLKVPRYPQLCAITDKRSYPSEKSAKKTLRLIQTRPGANHLRVPTYAYQCEFCKKWHLTSQEYRKQAG